MLKGSFIGVFLILTLLFSESLSQNIFSTSPDVTFYTSSSSATQIKISPYGDKVAVGFNNGSIQIYTTKGSWYYTFYGHYSKIIDIEWNYASGLITLDSSGKAIVWSDSGSQLKVWQFNNTVYDMSLSGYSIAFSFANKIQQYSSSSYYLKTTYLPGNGYQFRKIRYDQYNNILYTGYNNSYAQLYSTSTGKSFGYLIYTYGTIQNFSIKNSNNKVVALTSNNYLIEIDSSGSLVYLGSVTSSSRVVVCSGKNAIALSQKYYSDVAIYDYNGFLQQNLLYLSSSPTGMDCDYNNLVTVDTYGYVTINYGESNKAWIIGVVSGSIFILLCIVVIICIVKKRKRKINYQCQINIKILIMVSIKHLFNQLIHLNHILVIKDTIIIIVTITITMLILYNRDITIIQIMVILAIKIILSFLVHIQIMKETMLILIIMVIHQTILLLKIKKQQILIKIMQRKIGIEINYFLKNYLIIMNINLQFVNFY